MFNFVNSILRGRKELPNFGTGLVKGPVDTRDRLLSSCMYLPKRVPEEFPPLFDYTISNQKQEPSCAGHAAAYVKQDKEFRERVSQQFDGDWIYRECKKIDNLPNVRGTFFRVSLKVLQKQGAMPVGGGDPAKFKIGSYALVDDDSFEGLKKAFCVNGVLLVGYTLSHNGWRSAYVRPPKAGETTGGHAVVIAGYTKTHLIGINSWGEEWGDNGYFYIPKDYKPMQAWAVMTDLPTPPETGIVGWVAEKFLSNDQVVPSVGLKLRQGAGLHYDTIKVLPKGTEVEILGDRVWSDGYYWIKVRVDIPA